MFITAHREGEMAHENPEKKNDMVSVVLADDHARVRAGIRNILEGDPRIVVLGEASDGYEALNLVDQLEPDVLVLDVEMPRLNGNQVATKLIQNKHPVIILALSAYDDRQYIKGMLNLGISGYLTKEEAPEILVEAVHGVARGEKGWVTERVAKKIAALSQRSESETTLTHRELDILRLLAAGKDEEDIAGELNLDASLIQKHVELLCRKLKVDSIENLIEQAKRESLI